MKKNNQFLILAFISAIIVIGLFISPETMSGHATSEKQVTTWHCGFYSTSYDPRGSWRWVSWPDTEIRLEGKIMPKDAGCVTGEWVCPYNRCGANKAVEDCYCIK